VGRQRCWATPVCRGTIVQVASTPALNGGATPLKPAKKGFWGYGGVVQAPDGAIWKVTTSSKKDTGPATRQIDDIVRLLGVEDAKTGKQFYVDRGLAVTKSFGRKYVEFVAPGSQVTLALLGRHRIVIGSDAGSFTAPDGFAWESASV
jgi:predicted lactoylglutathione lyase